MHYFDASYLIPLVKPEAFSERIEAFVASIADPQFVTSFWTPVECRSGLAREVRMGRVSESSFKSCCEQLDELIQSSIQLILPTEDDYRLAARMIERPLSGLRSGDSIHLAIARRLKVERFLTLDSKLISVGIARGIRAGTGFGQGIE